MKIYVTLVFACFLAACQSPAPQSAQEKTEGELPNIVLIIGDDHGYPYFGFMGADYVQTPHMDSLVASGTLFTNGYVPSNHCRPSLQTLITGILPSDYAAQEASFREAARQEESYQALLDEERQKWEANFNFQAMQYFNTLPKMLAERGYATWQGGKWWEFTYQNGGFDEGMTTGWTEEEKEDGANWFLQFMGGEGRKLIRKTSQPAYDFVDEYKEQPFFLWFAPELPHYPFDAPDQYYDLYAEEEMTESAKRYYANCTWFDDGVGNLVQYLREKDEFDNTLFIYVNDNGWEQRPEQEFRHDSLRWHNGGDKGKLSVYDQSFRTPIIFSWPGRIEAGRRVNALMHSADIPATILDYVDLPIPVDFYGMSYRSVLEQKEENLRSEIVGKATQIRWEGDMMGRQVEAYWYRDQEWFYQQNLTTEQEMLYQMSIDPNNDNNVVAEHPAVVEAIQAEIEQWKAARVH